MMYRGIELTPLIIVADLLFIHQVDISHQWYMPMILGMYILIPFLSKAIRNFDIPILIFPVLFYTVYVFLCPLINVTFSVLGLQPLNITMSLGYSGGVYGLYLVYGYLLKKRVLIRVPTWILPVTSVISYAAGVACQLWAYRSGFTYNIWYDSPFLLVAAISVFELCSRMKSVPCLFAFKWLSEFSFAIYLTHNLIRPFLFNAISMSSISISNPLKVITIWIGTMILSCVVSWMISKIPVVGNPLIFHKA